ncbi:hypothetical protein OJ587_11795, partial [Streptococcus anginosus]|nr:hypothetical protein [Streptococcus anginosus]
NEKKSCWLTRSFHLKIGFHPRASLDEIGEVFRRRRTASTAVSSTGTGATRKKTHTVILATLAGSVMRPR